MSRKDYRLIASAVAVAAIPPEARKEITRSLGEFLASDNPRFNRGRFTEACNG